MKDFLQLTKALADENRLRMLMALQEGELCVCQMTELLGLAMSTVSKHLSLLYERSKGVAAVKCACGVLVVLGGVWLIYSAR